MNNSSVREFSSFTARLFDAFLLRWKWFTTGPVRRRLKAKVLELDRRNYVFVSNNCIAGQLYEMADLQKRSPTAGLFFTNGAFGQFLEAIASGQVGNWSSVSHDMIPIDPAFPCPVWDRGGKDSVVFLHYADPRTAADKWTARFPRMVGRTPIVIATLRAGLERDEMNRVGKQFEHLAIMEPSRGRIDNDGLDRPYLARLNVFLEGVLAAATRAS